MANSYPQPCVTTWLWPCTHRDHEMNRVTHATAPSEDRDCASSLFNASRATGGRKTDGRYRRAHPGAAHCRVAQTERRERVIDALQPARCSTWVRALRWGQRGLPRGPCQTAVRWLIDVAASNEVSRCSDRWQGSGAPSHRLGSCWNVVATVDKYCPLELDNAQTLLVDADGFEHDNPLPNA